MENKLSVVLIDKARFRSDYHPRLVLPHRHEVLKLNQNRWKGKAIYNLIMIHTDKMTEIGQYNKKIYIGDIPNVYPAIKKVLNQSWGYARKVASALEDHLSPDPEEEEEITEWKGVPYILRKEPSFILREENVVSRKGWGWGIYTTEYHYQYHPVIGHSIHDTTWKFDAIQKMLPRSIYHVSLNMPQNNRYTVYPMSDGIKEKMEEIANDTWGFAKKIYRVGWEKAKQWKKGRDQEQVRLANKREELKQETLEEDPLVHVAPVGYSRDKIYYKGTHVDNIMESKMPNFTLTDRYYGMQSMQMHYSVLKVLKDLSYDNVEKVSRFLTEHQDEVENGDITGDDIKAMLSVL